MQGNPAACRCCLAGTCHGLYRVSRKKWCVGASPFCFFSYLCAVKVHFSCENVGERPEQKPQDVGIECFDFFALREHVPIKQGLRLSFPCKFDYRAINLREHVPIKQGLRPLRLPRSYRGWHSQRACSNKTRIKTAVNTTTPGKDIPQRACSNKTRIKTSLFIILLINSKSQRACSNKTRIKTILVSIFLVYL